MSLVPLKELCQLDVQLEQNVPCPLWRAFSTRNDEDFYDPVEYARQIAFNTVTKSQANAAKIKQFQKVTNQRNRRASSKLLPQKVVENITNRQKTQYEVHLCQVTNSMEFIQNRFSVRDMKEKS